VSKEGSTTIRFNSIRCPFCEVYEFERFGDGSARCASCKRALGAELLATIRQIQVLPHAVGSHPPSATELLVEEPRLLLGVLKRGY
jgi:hypothetical protein